MSVSKKTKRIVLTPDHNYWRALGLRLNQSLIQYRCAGDLRLTKYILKTLPYIDVDNTLISFKEMGGNCDCHVLFSIVGIEVIKNAAPSGY